MKKISLILVLFCLTLASIANSQAEAKISSHPITPPPVIFEPKAFKLENVYLTVEIDGQKAKAVLRYDLINESNQTAEADFLLPLPKNAVISQMLTLIDGQELKGEIYEKDEAWRIYSELVRKVIDPGLLEYSKQGLYRARIFPVPAKGKAALEVKSEFLLNLDDNKFNFSYPVASLADLNKNVPLQDIVVTIKNNPELTNIYSTLENVQIEKKANGEATLKLKLEKEKILKTFDFYFATEKQKLGGMLFSHKPNKNEDGYFLFVAEPNSKISQKNLEISKNVLFVLDKSGSMSGDNIEQARNAATFVLERLENEDNFNLYTYNSELETWAEEIKVINEANRKDGLNFISNIRANGYTNIELALTKALEDLNSFGETNKSTNPSYILFLTDGLPTAGEKEEVPLANLIKKANVNEAKIFSFGVGYQVNARLLDRISADSNGTTVFVNPEDNIEDKIASLFNKLSSPVLVKTKFNSSVNVNRLIPTKMPDVFKGSQLILVGRYPKGGDVKINLSGFVGETEENYTYNLNLASDAVEGGSFIERFWAQKRIAEIIDDIDLNGKEDELLNELIELSKKYGILTPYTSFLALEDSSLTNVSKNKEEVRRNVEILENVVGEEANKQRSYKAEVKYSNVMQPQQSEGLVNELALQDKAVIDAKASRNAKLNAPKQINSKTFFYKNNVWQDSILTEREIENAVKLIILSDDYFNLLKDLSSEEVAWFAQKETALIKLNDKVYLLENK